MLFVGAAPAFVDAARTTGAFLRVWTSAERSANARSMTAQPPVNSLRSMPDASGHFGAFGGRGSDDRVFILPRGDRKACDAAFAG